MPDHPFHDRFYPIIYVRGFAATMGEIEDTVATPYMGFNLGATKIRQDHRGEIVRFIFESPLIRLMKDHGYLDAYEDGDLVGEDKPVPARSIWIFRYYEEASKDLGGEGRQSIPQIAEDLRRLVLRVRKQVCGEDAEARQKFRVHLVAHSMGGLVCRCYLQNLCANGTGDAELDAALELEDRPLTEEGHVADEVHLVDKVFTYATPHNGIDFMGFNAPNLGRLDPFHARNFNRKAMHEYLALPGQFESKQRVDTLNGKFPIDRFFCLVGTNYGDYTAFLNLSRRATGAMSDGLVMIENACVQRAPRAFAYRSHSGHYGIVNSEEGYQNLRRFLFGDVGVEARLYADEITLPRPVQKLKDAGREIRASYHIDTAARVRGALYCLHERRFEQASALFVEYDEMVKQHKPLYLFNGYLMKAAKTAESNDTALAFAIRIAIRVPMYEVDRRFWFDEHFEGGFLFDETVTLHVRLKGDGSTTVRFGLASDRGLGDATKTPTVLEGEDGRMVIELPLGFSEGAATPPRPGFRGRLQLVTHPWNVSA
jgi:hypothetical protein